MSEAYIPAIEEVNEGGCLVIANKATLTISPEIVSNALAPRRTTMSHSALTRRRLRNELYVLRKSQLCGVTNATLPLWLQKPRDLSTKHVARSAFASEKKRSECTFN